MDCEAGHCTDDEREDLVSVSLVLSLPADIYGYLLKPKQ